jgi:DNA-binding IclR family transcriptional regulator
LSCGLAILACFSQEQPAHHVDQLAATLKLPASAAAEDAHNLIELGYLCQDASGDYRLAERLPRSLVFVCG